MKKGKWNYTEDIEYTVVEVMLSRVPEIPFHWQNSMSGEVCQAVLIKHGDYQFMIDNQDGSGLNKISKGGGPDSYSAHISGCETIREIPEHEWNQWNPIEHKKRRQHHDDWLKEHHPEQFQKIESLRKHIQS